MQQLISQQFKHSNYQEGLATMLRITFHAAVINAALFASIAQAESIYSTPSGAPEIGFKHFIIGKSRADIAKHYKLVCTSPPLLSPTESKHQSTDLKALYRLFNEANGRVRADMQCQTKNEGSDTLAGLNVGTVFIHFYGDSAAEIKTLVRTSSKNSTQNHRTGLQKNVELIRQSLSNRFGPYATKSPPKRHFGRTDLNTYHTWVGANGMIEMRYFEADPRGAELRFVASWREDEYKKRKARASVIQSQIHDAEKKIEDALTTQRINDL